MAYSLQLPNGTVVEGIPDNVNRFEALSRLRQQFPQAFSESRSSGWNKGTIFPTLAGEAEAPQSRGVMASFGKGVETAASGLTTLGQSIFGDAKEASEAGIKRAEEIDKKYVSEGDLEKIKAIYAEKGVGPALKEVARQFPHVVAENLPQILASILGGVAGTALAGGNPLGGMLGAGLVSGSMQAGSNLERQAQAQLERGEAVDPSLGKAAVAGTAQAALDVFALGKLGLGRFVGMPAKTAEAELLATANRSLKGTLGRGAAAGTTEIPTEIAQQVIERAQAGLPLTSEDAWKEYQQAGYAAALLGPSIGGAMSPINRASARDEIERRQRAKDEQDTLARIEAEAARKASPEYLNSLEGIVDQKKLAIQERQDAKRALAKAKKAAQNEEITPDDLAAAEAEHAAAEEKVRALLAREIEVKKTPEQRFIEGVDQSYQYANIGTKKDPRYGPVIAPAAKQQAPGEFLPGVPMSEAPKDVDDTGVNKLGFTPDYKTATPEEALLLSMTDPRQYAGWQRQTNQQQFEEALLPEALTPPGYEQQFNTRGQYWRAAPQAQGENPTADLVSQQEQMWQDDLAQQMGGLREQSLERVQGEQEADALDRAASAMENWGEQKRTTRMQHPGTAPRYLEGRRDSKLAEFLRVPPDQIAKMSDADIQYAIKQRAEALRREQAALAGTQLTNRQMDEQGNVVGVGVQSQERLNRLGQIDMELADLERLKRLYSGSLQQPDSLAASMLAEEAARAFPQPKQEEARPDPTGPVVEPTPIKPKRPIIGDTGTTSLLAANQSRVLPPQQVDASMEKRERLRRAQALADKRNGVVADFMEAARDIHDGNFIGEADVYSEEVETSDGGIDVVEEKRPRNVKVRPVSAESTIGTLKKRAIKAMRTAIELSIQEAAERFAANGARLPKTQAQIFSGEMSTLLRRYLQRAEANVRREQFEPNITQAEDSRFEKEFARLRTPFDNINAAEEKLDNDIDALIESLNNDIVGNYMNAPEPKAPRTRSPLGKELGLTRPTPEGLAKEEGVARGTNRQQNLDYVYERVRNALEERATPITDETYGRAANVMQVLPPAVRQALQAAERALRESFEGVIQGDVYADRQQSKVTPALLQDIETLLDTKDPQDAARVMDGLRLVQDVNVEDIGQGELFADQADQPQVRIVKRSPFHLRQFINSKHVQQLKELLKPVEHWEKFLQEQLRTLQQKYEESLKFMVANPASEGAAGRAEEASMTRQTRLHKTSGLGKRQKLTGDLERPDVYVNEQIAASLAHWNTIVNNLRMVASRMDAANEQAKQQNYEYIENQIQHIYTIYEGMLNSIHRQVAEKSEGEGSLAYITKAINDEYARLRAETIAYVNAKTEEARKLHTGIRGDMRQFAERAKSSLIPRLDAMRSNAEALVKQAHARQREAERIANEMRDKARAAAAAQEEARARFKAATKVSAKQEKVVTEYPRELIGKPGSYVADRVIERKITKDESPNAATPLYDKYKEALDAAEREGARIGEAEYDALPPAERLKMDKWRNQVTRVNNAATALATAEKALTTFEEQAVSALEQATRPVNKEGQLVEGQKRNYPSGRDTAKVLRTVPKKGRPLEIRALQQAVEKAELELLQQWDALEQLSEGISDKMVRAGIKKALNLSDNATALEQVAGVNRMGQMPHGGQRPPQRVSPMNKTKHSLAAVRRAEMNKEKHPAEMPATRPGERGEQSPTTSSSAPYTKDMGGSMSSAQELLRERLRAKFAKKKEGRDTITAQPKRETILRSQATEAALTDDVMNAVAAAQYPQRARAADTPFGQKLADAVGDKALKGGDTMLRTGATPGIALEVAVAKAQQAARLFPSGGLLYYFPTPDAIPQEVLAKLPAGTQAQDVKGGMLPDGTMLLVGSTHANEADMDATITHEIVGHYKAERVLMGTRTGLQYMTDLAAKHLSGPPKVAYDLMAGLGFSAETVSSVATDSLNAENPDLYMLREIVARTSEMKPGSMPKAAQRFFQELWGAFKRVLRDHFGIDLKLSPSDVFYIVKRAQDGEVLAKEGGEAALRTATAPVAVDTGVRKLFPDRPSWKSSAKKNFLGYGLRTQYIDRWAPVKGVASRMVDGLKASQMIYMVSMADRTNQMTAEAMTHGPISLVQVPRKDGRTEFMFQSKKGVSVRDILKTLKGQDFKRWAAWMALKRAQQLGKGLDALLGDKAPTLSQEEVQAILAYGDSIPAFIQARDQYKAYNEAMIKLLVDTGAITQEAAKNMLSRDYIPFYRVDPNGDVRVMGEHAMKIGNVRDQADLARLIGSDRPLDDPFQNIATNTRILTKLALQNEAAKSVAFTLQELGLAKISNANMRGKAEQGRNVIHFKYKGQDRTAIVDTSADSKYLDIPSDLLVKGMEGIATTLPDFLRVLQVPAKFLRNAITLMPTYMFRQLVRDPMHAWLSTGMDFSKAAGAFTRVRGLANHRDETGNLLRERGLVGGQVIQGNDEDMARIMAQLHAGDNMMTQFHAKLHEYATASDAATRAAMYDSYKAKGLSDMEATLATMEAVNFASRGLSPTIHALNMMIPFFNAQIQGIDSVWRALNGQMPFNEKMKARQRLVQRAMMLAAGTTMYYALVQDEEWYKNTPENVRLSNWLIKVPGIEEPVRIPIPFEFGFMFKSVPEAIYMASKNDKEAEGAWAALGNMAANQIPGGSSFFIPAAVKPVLESAANHSFFTGRPIVPGGLEDAEPQDQWTLNTTETAKRLAGGVGGSPMHFENLVRGYTGPAGYAVLQLLDAIIQPTAVPPPEKPLSRTAIIGPLFQQIDSTAVINRAYDRIKKIESAAARYRTANEQGRFEDAEATLQESGNLIGFKSLAGRFRQEMGKLTKLERQIHFAQMDPAEKAQQLRLIRQLKIEKAKQFNDYTP